MADPARTWPALDLHFPLPTDNPDALEARLLAALDDLSPIGIEDEGALTWRVFWSTRDQRDRARASLLQLFSGARLEAEPADVADQNWVERSQAELGPVRVQGSTGRAATVVSVWIVLVGEDYPHFVTAYPGVKS